MQTRERAHYACSVFPFIKNKTKKNWAVTNKDKNVKVQTTRSSNEEDVGSSPREELERANWMTGSLYLLSGLTPPRRINLHRFYPWARQWFQQLGGGGECLECHCQKQASLLPSQLFSFPSIVLTVLENETATGKTWETTEYKLSTAIIQNCFYGAYTVLLVWGPLYLHYIYTLYCPLWRS